MICYIEVSLLEAWWNYTMVSCVANICDEFKFPVYDSMIFWYNLNVRRIQLLFKDHKGYEGAHFVKQKIDFAKEDQHIQEKLLSSYLESENGALRIYDDEEEEEEKSHSADKKVSVVLPVSVRKHHTHEHQETQQEEEEEEEEQLQEPQNES